MILQCTCLTPGLPCSRERVCASAFGSSSDGCSELAAGTCRLGLFQPRKSLPCSTGNSLRRLVLQALLLGRIRNQGLSAAFEGSGCLMWKGWRSLEDLAVRCSAALHVCESMLVAKSGQDHHDINLGEFLPKCTTSLGKDRWVDSGSQAAAVGCCCVWLAFGWFQVIFHIL